MIKGEKSVFKISFMKINKTKNANYYAGAFI